MHAFRGNKSPRDCWKRAIIADLSVLLNVTSDLQQTLVNVNRRLVYIAKASINSLTRNRPDASLVCFLLFDLVSTFLVSIFCPSIYSVRLSICFLRVIS